MYVTLIKLHFIKLYCFGALIANIKYRFVRINTQRNGQNDPGASKVATVQRPHKYQQAQWENVE